MHKLNKKQLIAIINAFLMIPIIIMLIRLNLVRQNELSENDIALANIALSSVYCLAIFTWYYRTGNIASTYFLFLLYSFACNAGQTLLQFFPETDFLYTNIYHAYSRELVYKQLVYQAMCILSLHYGVLIALNTGKIRYSEVFDAQIVRNARKSDIQNILFYIVSSLMIITTVSQFILRLSYSYGDFYEMREGASMYVQALFYASAFSFYIRNRQDRMKKKLFYVIFVLQIVLNLLIGSRTALIPMMATMLTAYIIVNPRFFVGISRGKKLVFIAVALCFLTLISIISTTRTTAIGQGAGSGNSFFQVIGQGIHEMGQSAQTTIMTIDRIDAGTPKEPTLLYNFLVSFIPNPILSMIGLNAPSVGSLGEWVTRLANSRSGYGYSIVAESYFNFGEFGFMFFLLFGYVVVKLEQKCMELTKLGHLFIPQLIVVVLSFMPFLARAQFDLMTSRMRITFLAFCLWIVFVHRMKIPLLRAERLRNKKRSQDDEEDQNVYSDI